MIVSSGARYLRHRKIILLSVGLTALVLVTVALLWGLSIQNDQYAFYGEHQKGILTPPQRQTMVAAFDLTQVGMPVLKSVLQDWTVAADLLTRGQPVGEANLPSSVPPGDTGEAVGLSPAGLTLTFGLGASVFDGRFGLAAKRPAALIDLPSFPNDRLDTRFVGGDLGVVVCADDSQVVFHAVRALARIGQGRVVLRWVQQGFQAASPTTSDTKTGRNLQGFRDGTVNPDVTDRTVMNEVVWSQAGDGAPWMEGGTYLVVRRIRMFIEIWDRSSFGDQEQTIGRAKHSGAGFGAEYEKDAIDLTKKDANGKTLIPSDSHVALARGAGKEKILRRGYSFVDGLDERTGQWDAGLLFMSFQRDPQSQFVAIQSRLSNDKLNEYISTVGSALFACFPGVPKGGFLGQQLFN